jgi:hypothetical protein
MSSGTRWPATSPSAWIKHSLAPRLRTGPAGLGSLSGVQAVTAGEVTNLDAFAEAVSLAEDVGGLTTAFVATLPTCWRWHSSSAAATVTSRCCSRRPTRRKPRRARCSGCRCSAHPPWTTKRDETVWAIPQQFSFVVVREDAEVGVDTSAFFTSDRIGIRATLRVGIGWPHEAAIVKIRQRRKLSPHHSTPRPANYRAHLPGCSATR